MPETQTIANSIDIPLSPASAESPMTFDYFPPAPTSDSAFNTNFFSDSPHSGISAELPPPDFHGVSNEQLLTLAGDMAMGLTIAGFITAGVSRMWRFAWGLTKAA